ncbi:hypothetical protein [Bartonella sp. CB175]|uniref:hypothetical protein n=1 Tax=Bartonella sp. CB175 TaxID=3112256 RepID=UPI00300DF31A
MALGDTTEQLLQEFRRYLLNIQQNINYNTFSKEVAHVTAMVETPKLIGHYQYDMTLDISGTVFQKKL